MERRCAPRAALGRQEQRPLSVRDVIMARVNRPPWPRGDIRGANLDEEKCMTKDLEKKVLSALNDSRMAIPEIARKFEISEAEVDAVVRGALRAGEKYMDGHGY